jgi:hypothetical protein
MHARKGHRIVGHASDQPIDGSRKLATQARATRFVPPVDLQRFVFGLRPKDNPSRHAQPSILRRTSDQATADPGFCRCSAHRRSSSARCPALSSRAPSRSVSLRLSQSAIASSARSLAGSLRSSDSGLVCTSGSSHVEGQRATIDAGPMSQHLCARRYSAV